MSSFVKVGKSIKQSKTDGKDYEEIIKESISDVYKYIDSETNRKMKPLKESSEKDQKIEVLITEINELKERIDKHDELSIKTTHQFFHKVFSLKIFTR